MPKVNSPLKEKFAKRPKQERKPLWDGPESNSPQGGITQSLLSLFLVCRERFRIKVIEGLRPQETWNQRLGYGEMWHICEEHFANSGNPIVSNPVVDPPWLRALMKHTTEQCKKFPLQQEQIVHWYNVCKTQFPIYVKYWAKNTDVVNRTPLLQEQSFNVPYRLPSGRVVYLRGKWDSVDLVKRGRKQVIVLKENKTKGDIDEQQLQQQLTFDLQTMLYLVALDSLSKLLKHGGSDEVLASVIPNWKQLPGDVLNAICDRPISGINYNVVRRPLSGGKGSIRKHQPSKAKPLGESDEEYYGRLRGIIDGTAEGSPGPEYFFMRWNVDITPHDIEKFKTQFLNPCLEQLCDWYDEVKHLYVSDDNPFANTDTYRNFRTPFGLYNPLAEGGATDVDSYLMSGGDAGLVKAETLFRELE